VVHMTIHGTKSSLNEDGPDKARLYRDERTLACIGPTRRSVHCTDMRSGALH